MILCKAIKFQRVCEHALYNTKWYVFVRFKFCENALSFVLCTEAEYANRMKKELVIPLRIQEGYVATGWLGFEYGSLLYVDFTKPDFEAAYLKLCKEIEKKGRVNHIQCHPPIYHFDILVMYYIHRF